MLKNLLIPLIISYIVVNSNWFKTKYAINPTNKVMYMGFIFVIIYTLLHFINESKENFVLSDGTSTAKTIPPLDPNKFYQIGTLKTSNTITPSQNGGTDCIEFPTEVYRLVPPTNAVCRVSGDSTAVTSGNVDDNYNWSGFMWGMAVANTFISNVIWPWTTKGVIIYLRNKTTKKYLCWSTTNNCVQPSCVVADTPINGSKVFFYDISNQDLDVKGKGQWLCIRDAQGRQLICPWNGTVAQSIQLCMRPSGCVDEGSYLVVAPPENRDCSSNAPGGTNWGQATNTYAYSSWSTSLNGTRTGQTTTTGVWLGHAQSYFAMHPEGGNASNGVFAWLWKYIDNGGFTGDAGLFEWRYSKNQPQ